MTSRTLPLIRIRIHSHLILISGVTHVARAMLRLGMRTAGAHCVLTFEG